MKYCKLCLQPDTRPNDYFLENGVCIACNNYNKNKYIDYNKRIKILSKIIHQSSNSNKYFDCIIGVSGGKDSTRQALWVRDKLNLKPLLVSLAYPPEQVN